MVELGHRAPVAGVVSATHQLQGGLSRSVFGGDFLAYVDAMPELGYRLEAQGWCCSLAGLSLVTR